jgi:hypothetical protein
MVLINSLFVLPLHASGKTGITIFDNLQTQEILKLNDIKYNNIYNIRSEIHAEGFLFEPATSINPNRWFLRISDNNYNKVLYYNRMFSTTVYLNDIEHYWLCPNCTHAVPNNWNKCMLC